MFRSYILLTLRDLWKSKYFSLLNILGLGISITTCLLVMMLIKDASNFDRFHPEDHLLYRVVTNAQRKDGGSEGYATSPYPMASTISAQSSLIQQWVPLINRFNGELVSGEARFSFQGLATTPNFFNTFGFGLESGNFFDLNQSNVIVLTKPLALKLFPNLEPIGQSIQWAGHDFPLKVVGVMQPFPGKTHLEFEALTSVATILSSQESLPFAFNSNDWRDYYAGYHFFKLKSKEDKQKVESELNALAKERYATLDLESRDVGYTFELQALSAITPGRNLSNSMGKGIPSFLLIFLSFLGLIILVSAGFNHTNMALAKAVSRTKEIGLRKIIGAERRHIFSQFIIEAVITSFLATLVGITLLKVAIPLFNRLQFLQYADVSFNFSPSLLVWYFVFALAVGIVIGLVPSWALSSVNALKAVNAKGNVSILKRFNLRKGIIVTQLTLTLIFFFLISTGIKQVRYSLANSFGADKDYIVNLQLQGQEYKKVRTEFEKQAQVQSVSGASILMGTYFDSSVDIKLDATAEATSVRDYFIDENFLHDFDIELAAGNNFQQDYTQSHERSIIVNENFLDRYQLGSADQAIGKSIYLDTQLVSIRGVVKDFRFKPTNYAMEPLLLRYDPNQISLLHIVLNRSADLTQAVALIKTTWAEIDPHHAVQWSFFADDIKQTFSYVKDIIWIVSVFALIAAIICLMGLLGIVSYGLSSRKKEIAIRKVVGAQFKNLSWSLSRSYVMWLGLACLISIPLATLINNFWLSSFAVRVSWSLWWFVPGLLIMSISLMFTVGLQIIKAIWSNPVTSLRNE